MKTAATEQLQCCTTCPRNVWQHFSELYSFSNTTKSFFATVLPILYPCIKHGWLRSTAMPLALPEVRPPVCCTCLSVIFIFTAPFFFRWEGILVLCAALYSYFSWKRNSCCGIAAGRDREASAVTRRCFDALLACCIDLKLSWSCGVIDPIEYGVNHTALLNITNNMMRVGGCSCRGVLMLILRAGGLSIRRIEMKWRAMECWEERAVPRRETAVAFFFFSLRYSTIFRGKLYYWLYFSKFILHITIVCLLNNKGML